MHPQSRFITASDLLLYTPLPPPSNFFTFFLYSNIKIACFMHLWFTNDSVYTAESLGVVVKNDL